MKNAILILFPITALLYFPMAFEEFEQPKAYALITFGCFAAFWVGWKHILQNKIAMYLSIFALSAAASTFLSNDVHMSIFGNVKCPLGLLSILALLVFYLAVIEHTDECNYVLKIIDVIIGCSIIVSIYAVAQTIGYDPKSWKGTLINAGYMRPMSFLGHPNFLANYLGMVLPLAIWRATNVKETWIKALSIAATILSIVNIWSSLSRGMWIAAVAGMLVYFIYSKINLKTLLTISGFTTVLVLLTLVLFPVFRLTAIERMGVLLSPGIARLEYPKGAIRIWRHYPWFGIGTDAYEFGFQNQRTPYYWSVESAGSPHRAHNDFLNILATQGIFGAIAWTLLMFAIFFKCRDSKSRFVAPALASIVVFYVAGLTGFIITPTAVLFMFVVALLHSNEESYSRHSINNVNRKS